MNFSQRTRGIVQAIAVVVVAGVAARAGDLVGRRPRRRRRQSGSRGIADLFGAAQHDRPRRARRSRSTAPSPSRAAPGWALRLRRAGGGFFNRPGGHARRPRRGLPRRRPARHAVRRRDVLRPRRIVVDHRPDPADRPDHHRGATGDVVVAAPPHAGAGLCRCARCGRRRLRNAASAPEWASDWDRAARRSKSSLPTMRRSNGCSARSRPRGRTRTSPSCIRWRRPKWCRISPRTSRQNKARNDINKVSDVKLLQGDLAEAWREGETDYASVAMRFSLVDKTLDRATGRLVAGSEHAGRGDGGVDLRAAARRQLGTFGDPADQLIACMKCKYEAPRFIPRRLFLFAFRVIRVAEPE